ncbi:MAG: ArnT family glycosyltransferase [Planctomycetota bacterium]|jgi:hypothetical protein
MMEEARPGGEAMSGETAPPGDGRASATAEALAGQAQTRPDSANAGGERPGIVARVTGSLPALFMKYERLCERIASRGVHNVAFYVSTGCLAPVGLYVWESRKGRAWPGRLWRGIAAWVLLFMAIPFMLEGKAIGVPGFVLAIPALALGRPLRWLLRLTRLSRARPSPEIPRKLTFEIRALDIAALVFISVIFLVMVANRDELARMDGVTDSDPAYHMAVAKQIIDNGGGLPRWDYWEYAPFGRPHLYHPALHYLIAFFSWKSGDVLHGFNTIQMLLYPLALFGGWYFARWLFGAACGFLALIFLSMETSFLFTQAGVLPSAVVTAMIPLILMAFLARRTVATVLLLTIALYTHGPLGVPQLVILGLLVFSMRHREWFPFFRKVVAFAGLLYLPWIARMSSLDCLEWFGSSVGAMGPAKNAAVVLGRGLLQLQIVSPILLFLAFRTWWRDGDRRLGVVKALLLGFLPMLFAYGGRYFMHTAPLWAVLVARNFEAWLSRPEAAAEEADPRARRSLRRRTLAFVGLAFVPLPVISFGMRGARQGMHVWPGFTGMNVALVTALHRSEPDREFERLAEHIRKLLPPERLPTEPPPHDPPRPPPPPPDMTWQEQLGKRDLESRRRASQAGTGMPAAKHEERPAPSPNRVGKKTYDDYLSTNTVYADLRKNIVHVGEGRVAGNPFMLRYGSLYLGNRLTVATGCRTDTGGWGPEVRSDLMAREAASAREAPTAGLFVFFDKRKVIPDHEAERLRKAHALDWMRRFGPHYLLGGRGIAEEPVEEF